MFLASGRNDFKTMFDATNDDAKEVNWFKQQTTDMHHPYKPCLRHVALLWAFQLHIQYWPTDLMGNSLVQWAIAQITQIFPFNFQNQSWDAKFVRGQSKDSLSLKVIP